MHALTGYCDRWSVKPGATVRFMVSSSADAPFAVRFVRHLCADPNPRGPGYREIAMPTAIDGTRPGRAQPAALGSFAHAPAIHADLSAGFSIGATIWPTLPSKTQTIVSISADRWRAELGIDANGCATATVRSAEGAVVLACSNTALQVRRWYDVALTLSADGALGVAQSPRRPVGRILDAGEGSSAGAELPSGETFEVRLAAGADGNHYNGKLERPTIWRGTHATAAILERQRGAVPHATTPDLIACWDFSRAMAGNLAVDVGPLAAHARLVALPTRAMTGAPWTGAVHDWKHAPEQYAAIHFHEDDQGDLGWAETFALDVPADWPSGFYAAHIGNDAGEDYIPFFVRPLSPRAALAFLVPTYTYQVYGCFVRAGRGAEISARAAEWGALRETPDRNPSFGLSAYNTHSDGSGVAITSMRRPMLDTRPRQVSLMDPSPGGSGTGRICADAYILAWLDLLGIDCDIVTDHDLHAEGVAALAPYRTVIAGQHPEYHSERMMVALEDYLGGGGRLMYLGGNGFYWRAEPSEAEPHAIEIRRAESGIRVWASEPGEYYHAHGGGYGGLWRRIGRSAHRLVGNGFSVQGRHLGFPYRFTDAIADPRVAFMRVGLGEVAASETKFGDDGFMGGGAAGFELDSADEKFGTPPNALIVAKGVVIHDDYRPVNEDMLVIRHPRPHEDWSCADMVFFETPAGGAVFSVGSMTYVGSLLTEGGENTLSRLTGNVLRRFLDPAPFA